MKAADSCGNSKSLFATKAKRQEHVRKIHFLCRRKRHKKLVGAVPAESVRRNGAERTQIEKHISFFILSSPTYCDEPKSDSPLDESLFLMLLVVLSKNDVCRVMQRMQMKLIHSRFQSHLKSLTIVLTQRYHLLKSLL